MTLKFDRTFDTRPELALDSSGRKPAYNVTDSAGLAVVVPFFGMGPSFTPSG